MVASLIAKGKDQGFLLSEEVLEAFPRIEDDIAAVDAYKLFTTFLIGSLLLEVAAHGSDIAGPPYRLVGIV